MMLMKFIQLSCYSWSLSLSSLLSSLLSPSSSSTSHLCPHLELLGQKPEVHTHLRVPEFWTRQDRHLDIYRYWPTQTEHWFGHGKFISRGKTCSLGWKSKGKAQLSCEKPLHTFQVIHEVDIARHNLPIFLKVKDVHARVLPIKKESKFEVMWV